MKKIYLFFAILSTLASKAQPFDLIFDHPWYLEQIRIDGTFLQIPSNGEVTNAILNFYETTPYTFDLKVCQTLSGEITYPNYDAMLFPVGLTITGDACTISENIDFETILFNFFQSQIGVQLSYDYIFIDPGPPENILVIFSPNGDYIEFTEVPNPILGVESFNKKMFSVFPNPFTDKITIRNLNSQILSKIRVLSMQGSLLLETNNSNILAQNLTKGIYILEIIAKDGSKQIEKIVKK